MRGQLQARTVVQAEWELLLQLVERTQPRAQRVGWLVEFVGARVHFAVDGLVERVRTRMPRAVAALPKAALAAKAKTMSVLRMPVLLPVSQTMP